MGEFQPNPHKARMLLVEEDERVVPTEMLRRTIALFNQCDWTTVCAEVSELIEEIATHIDGEV